MPRKNSNANSKPTITLVDKTQTIDFESDTIQDLEAGDTGDEFVFAGFTVEGVSNSPSGIANEAMIFDSENPTGGDTDLETDDQGNILIVSEDGVSENPDDEANGGTLTFDFDEPVSLSSILVVDAFEGGGEIEAFDDEGNSLGVIEIPDGGPDGEIGTIDLSPLTATEGASKLVVTFDESGAVDDLEFGTRCITVDKDVSNIVLYLDCGDEDVIKFKIDDFEDGTNEISVTDLALFLDTTEFGDCDILGLTVKAGNNGGNYGPGEGEFIDLNLNDDFEDGTTDKADVEVSASDFLMFIA